MRLLDTNTGQFVDKDPERTIYAILSHTWDDKGEQTYEQLRSIQRRYVPVSQTPPNSAPVGSEGVTSSSRKWNRDGTLCTAVPSSTTSPYPPTALGNLTPSEVEALRAFIEVYGLASPTPASASIWDDPELSPKIRDACAVARSNGYDYIWIDSCCIDKSSSSELSEAINSMYKWYGFAVVCYAYLADVPPGSNHQAEDSAFRKSRWFQRGWTLQELIAPLDVEFLSEDWAPIGSKHDLVELVESVTKIDPDALLHLEPLDKFSVAQRFSWAANRETTRREDRAYSLLGIFDINIPTLYGEGDRAFQRLQEQIMQRIPDQSLFAWGDVYLGSMLINIGQYCDPQPSHSHTWERFFTMSSGLFGSFGGEVTKAAGHHAIQLTSSHLHTIIGYTTTPYGIRTQFEMIPLTQDLLLSAIQLSDFRDVQLRLSRSRTPKDSQWYLAILQCEHSEYPGHLLGWVCYITPSESGIEFVHPGYIDGITLQQGVYVYSPNLFPLSPETIEQHGPQTELKTVYIPYSDRSAVHSSRLRFQPYTTIKLVLPRKTRDALVPRGYLAGLRAPDPAHPTTHSLTLTKDKHTITVEFQHTLEDDGGEFTIHAKVKMLPGSRAQVDSALCYDQGDRRTVSWWDFIPWRTQLNHESVRLNAAGAGTLTLDLGLDFGGHGIYFLRVDVLSDAPSASSAVEPDVDLGGEARERTEENSHSGAVETEDAVREEAGGCEMESMDFGDVAATSGDIEGEDSNGAST